MSGLAQFRFDIAAVTFFLSWRNCAGTDHHKRWMLRISSPRRKQADPPPPRTTALLEVFNLKINGFSR